MAAGSRTQERTASAEHNLPVPLTSVVGRGRELEGITATLRRTRIVTLTGPGGVGKTRLALALAHRQVARRADGVWLVDLASGPETPDVAAETARRLAVGTARAGTPTEALCRSLADRDLLLVLDNCEHVVDACAELASALLTSCGQVRIMATGRELLGVDGETVWRLEPLEPEDARRLFLERARQRQPEFLPDEEADATIERLCARLDRLPLAIELAAARMSAMSPAEVLSDLETRLGTLGGNPRLSPPHHRTVRAAVEWSHQLLETVREFARELLEEAGGLDAARDRHLRHFSGLADVAREEWLTTGAHRFVNQLDDDYENVRAAVEWAATSDPCAGTRVLGGIRDLFFRFGQADGLRLARLLLERCPARDRHRVEAQIAAAQFWVSGGDPHGARSVLVEARELSAELGEPVLEAWVRFFQGLSETLGGDVDAAREHLQASRDLHEKLGIGIGQARATAVLGTTSLMRGEPGRRRSCSRPRAPSAPPRGTGGARASATPSSACSPSRTPRARRRTTAGRSTSCALRGTRRCCRSR